VYVAQGNPLLDVSRLHSLGWQHGIELAKGVADTYQWFLDNTDSLRSRGTVAV